MAQAYIYTKNNNSVYAIKYTDSESFEEIKELVKGKRGFSVKEIADSENFCLYAEVKLDSDRYTSNSILRKGDYAVLNESSDFPFQSISAEYFENNYTII